MRWPKVHVWCGFGEKINGSNAGARSLQKSGHLHGKSHQTSEELKANFWHKRYHNRQGKNINTFFKWDFGQNRGWRLLNYLKHFLAPIFDEK